MRINDSGNIGIGTTSPQSKLSVNGGVAIGSAYAGISTASPGNLIISGSVGVGTASPANNLDVSGGAAIGATYVGTNTAPANGAIIQGNVGVGTTSPAAGAKVDINGPVKVAGTGSEPCTAAQVGMIRYNPTGQYFEACNYP